MLDAAPLCTNRVPLPGAPSTCTLDVILIPLPSVLFIIAFFGLAFRSPSRLWTSYPTPVLPKWLHIAYTVLVFCAAAMGILEVIRLILQHEGVGLLPISIIAVGMTFALLVWRGVQRTPSMSALLVCYWALYTVMAAIKTVRLHSLEKVDPRTNKDSKYPSSDWFLDNAVMLCLYIVFALVEGFYLVRSRREVYTSANSYKV